MGHESRRAHIISIHALRKESDLDPERVTMRDAKFQSTLSVRRATIKHAGLTQDEVDFNPRSP